MPAAMGTLDVHLVVTNSAGTYINPNHAIPYHTTLSLDLIITHCCTLTPAGWQQWLVVIVSRDNTA